jgi:hypothetical protein
MCYLEPSFVSKMMGVLEAVATNALEECGTGGTGCDDTA